MNIGDRVECVNANILDGNDKAPKLVEGEFYIIKDIILDSKNNPHYDVGLKSRLNFVRSYETKEELPNGDKIHWCHSSRFKKVD